MSQLSCGQNSRAWHPLALLTTRQRVIHLSPHTHTSFGHSALCWPATPSWLPSSSSWKKMAVSLPLIWPHLLQGICRPYQVFFPRPHLFKSHVAFSQGLEAKMAGTAKEAGPYLIKELLLMLRWHSVNNGNWKLPGLPPLSNVVMWFHALWQHRLATDSPVPITILNQRIPVYISCLGIALL